MTTEEFAAEYERLQHAMQTGVKITLERDLLPIAESVKRELKHLRVGINSAMMEVAFLARLLIKKGLITEAEYFEAMLQGMKQEVRRYEESLTKELGTKITLM